MGAFLDRMAAQRGVTLTGQGGAAGQPGERPAPLPVYDLYAGRPQASPAAPYLPQAPQLPAGFQMPPQLLAAMQGQQGNQAMQGLGQMGMGQGRPPAMPGIRNNMMSSVLGQLMQPNYGIPQVDPAYLTQINQQHRGTLPGGGMAGSFQQAENARVSQQVNDAWRQREAERLASAQQQPAGGLESMRRNILPPAGSFF